MSVKVFPIIIGSNKPIVINMSDATDDTAINFTGCSGYSANAKREDTGELKNFSSVSATDPTSGEITLSYATDMFTEVGLWSIQIKCTDPTGHQLIMPSEEGQMLVRVGAANA